MSRTWWYGKTKSNNLTQRFTADELGGFITATTCCICELLFGCGETKNKDRYKIVMVFISHLHKILNTVSVSQPPVV